ncbi:MAG: hypothetical protein ACKO5K_09080 [Armatimonadota bacterium]
MLATAHFTTRQAQRARTDATVALVLRYGRRFFEGDDRVFFLARRDIPSTIKPELAERAHGTVVVCRGDVLITTFRNPRYLQRLKRRVGRPRRRG